MLKILKTAPNQNVDRMIFLPDDWMLGCRQMYNGLLL